MTLDCIFLAKSWCSSKSCSAVEFNTFSTLVSSFSFLPFIMWKSFVILHQGWEFAHSFFWVNGSFLVSKKMICSWKRVNCSHRSLSWATGANRQRLFFCIEQWEQFADGLFYVKSDKSKLHRRTLKKSDWAEINESDLLLSIKKGKAVKKILIFFEPITCFLELVFETDPLE